MHPKIVFELSSYVLVLDGPIWQRWWFPALVVAAILGALVVFELYRNARMKELRAALKDEALRDSEVHFRSVSESASDAFITVDEKSSIISVTPAAEKIFGYSTVEPPEMAPKKSRLMP